MKKNVEFYGTRGRVNGTCPCGLPIKNARTILFAAILTLSATAAPALGFGKNKVQYQHMEWRCLNAPHYTLYYHQNQGELPEIAYIWLNDIYGGLSARFGYIHPKSVPVILYESPALFEQTNIITELLPEEVGGFTEIFKNRVAIPFNGSYSDLRHVLHHEMVHAFVFGAATGGIFRAASANIPLWFNEGLAEVLSSGWNREADMFMLDRVLNSTVPPPGPMLDGYLAYKGGQSFLYYLQNTGGDSLFNRMLREFKEGRDAEKAIETAYNATLEDLGRDWLSELRRIYWPEIGRRVDPATHAKAITNTDKGRSHFNLRPKISPDGKLIAFFSDKKDYTRIIITDTAGKETRQIKQHNIGESFESFQPFIGAMAWSPDSRSLAFAAKKGGRSEIRIVNTEKNGKQTRAIKLQLTSINGLDWSKDGQTLAITGIAEGRTDLFTYDLSTSTLTRLTNTPASKNSPHFSQDGKNIIFTITDTTWLAKAPHEQAPTSNIAVFDTEAKSVRLLTNTKWNDKQPAFSPDGKSFVFVSDRNGIDNLYIAPSDNPDKPRPITDYAGNCSNPDWAADGSAIVFDLFMNQSWNVWYMSKPVEKTQEDSVLTPTRWAEYENGTGKEFFRKRNSAALTSTPKDKKRKENNEHADAADSVNTALTDTISAQNNDSLLSINNSQSAAVTADTVDTSSINTIPADTVANSVDTSINTVLTDTIPVQNNDSLSLISNSQSAAVTTDSVDTSKDSVNSKTFTLKPHKDFVPIDGIPGSNPYTLRFTPDFVLFGLGVNTYSGAAGQAVATFSDIMGDHRITLAGDLQIDFTEYAQIYAAYHYLKHRVNMMAGAFYYKNYSYDGSFQTIYHDLETGGTFGLSYPFSMFSRVDLQLTGSHIERVPVAYYTETYRAETYETDLLRAALGFSYDNILWGITGPLKGIRAQAQLHAAPPMDFVDESYLSADIDIRHYTHILKRFVWANRLAAGGSIALYGGKSARRFLLGGNENWFNYDVNTDNYRENLDRNYSYHSKIVTPMRGWDYFDFDGDRMMMINSEFRFPFIREISTVWPLPMQIRYINGAFFLDNGYAWTREEQNGSFPIPPKLVSGFGFGMRANLGIFVLRYDRGWPTDWKYIGAPVNYFSLGAEF